MFRSRLSEILPVGNVEGQVTAEALVRYIHGFQGSESEKAALKTTAVKALAIVWATSCALSGAGALFHLWVQGINLNRKEMTEQGAVKSEIASEDSLKEQKARA